MNRMEAAKPAQMNTRKLKNLFLQQSCADAWEDYRRSLRKARYIGWDYVVLTASNAVQAREFERQIRQRLENGQLPPSAHYAVLPDPEGKRVGSGGATFNVLRYIAEREGRENPFAGRRVLVIHSGGDSKRVPQYSAGGKLFSPVPRELPDGRKSTLFDEFMIGMAGMPGRFRDGMLVLSGDVLLLFNPLQVDATYHGAAALSIKESVAVGKDHGVFLDDGSGYVRKFLHKQTQATLAREGAVNDQGSVNLDTGAVMLDSDLLDALYGLISTDGRPDPEKLGRFISEQARVSFYGDMLYPLAKASTLEQYYLEKPEGDYTEELRACRQALWTALRPFSLKLFCLSPAQFIHFGTTRELLQLMTEGVGDYEFLGWKAHVGSTASESAQARFASYDAYVGRRARVDGGAFIEDCYVLGESRVGRGCILSGLKLRDRQVPDGVVLHALPLAGERCTVRAYGVSDNPKGTLEEGVPFLGAPLADFVARTCATPEDLWDGPVHDLWNAQLFPVCDDGEAALDWALRLCAIAAGSDTGAGYLAMPRTSLAESFNLADLDAVAAWRGELECRILSNRFIDALANGAYYDDALAVFGERGITEKIYNIIEEDAQNADFSMKIRMYYALSRYMKRRNTAFAGVRYDGVEEQCFAAIRDAIYAEAVRLLPDAAGYRIVKDTVEVALPVRVNWGGGWTDTPPHCNEHGGVVLNAAISLRGRLPVRVCVRRLDERCVEFESQDVGAHGKVYATEDILDCHNPYDPFALHKAALICSGVVGLHETRALDDILDRLGGGIYLSTQVVGVPKGSGLGTSSILSGAAIKALFEFLGIEKSDGEIFDTVLSMEQIMSTGGGWQDQVGGLVPGIKFITSRPGMRQNVRIERVEIPEDAMRELSARFALIYTGQRRLARNLLRDVVGRYIGAQPAAIDALEKMRTVAALMRFYLEQGDIDRFAAMLNDHWELSKQLDAGTTNTCIDQIFAVCADMIDGRFIAGAGGGGFLMVILKKNVTWQMLHERLVAVFEDSGVDVWETEFV